jgi:undecaprenyl-diphosphatase
MSLFDAIILGIIQGLTEFLPVSSSGHLVLTEHLLNAKMPGIAFELVVHFGTLLSVIVYFRKKIIELIMSLFIREMKAERRMVLYIIIGTIPAGVLGVLFKDFFEQAFSSPIMTSIMLMVTGLILLSTALIKPGDYEINIPRSIIIGIGQAIAILPGISRSGASISAGMFTGVKPVLAAEFSFLLSIPAILGAVAFKIKDLVGGESLLSEQYLFGLLASFIFGLISVYFMLDIIKKGKFKYFGIYCLIAGLVGIVHFI